MKTFNLTSNRDALLSLMDVTNTTDALAYLKALLAAYKNGVITLVEFECNVTAFEQYLKSEKIEF